MGSKVAKCKEGREGRDCFFLTPSVCYTSGLCEGRLVKLCCLSSLGPLSLSCHCMAFSSFLSRQPVWGVQ